jgi:hypothetical protein
MSELDDLRTSVARQTARHAKRRQELYAYAREKGFNSMEAQTLSRRTKAYIDLVAQQKAEEEK